jgi:hypothetical protein
MTRSKRKRKGKNTLFLVVPWSFLCCSIDLMESDWERHLLVGLPACLPSCSTDRAGPVHGRIALASFHFRFVHRFAVLALVTADADSLLPSIWKISATSTFGGRW